MDGAYFVLVIFVPHVFNDIITEIVLLVFDSGGVMGVIWEAVEKEKRITLLAKPRKSLPLAGCV